VPGLAADRYGDVGVIHADSSRLLDEWLPDLRAHLEGVVDSAYAKIHPRSASRLSAAERAELAREEPVWGPRREVVVVDELGARYEIRPAAGLSVGLFLDMREVRAWLRANAQGRSVLNLFAYTCSMGVAAALGGATRVVNVDVSRAYLEWGKRNYALNGCEADDRDFIYGDAFDWLKRFARRGEQFDLAIVDPPSFSSTPFSVTRDYARLVEAAARVVSPGGMLLAATNHAPTTDARFGDWLRRGLASAQRRGDVIQRWHEPSPDFPLPPGQPPYLKVRALQVD
jgi:23S rRNA (cytosine1962-C5)-methyltransferase